MLHNPPKSNFSFTDLKFYNMSMYSHGKMEEGSAFAIHGVIDMNISHVVGELVPSAGQIDVAFNVRFDHVNISGKGGFSCGSNVSGVVADPATVSPMPSPKHGCK